MSLTTHPYHFFSDIQAFLNVWGKTLDKLTGEKILCVWGVWNIEDETWFDDAPMLVELTAGTLSVHVKCEKDLAIGWNDILLSDKPVWFDEYQIKQMPDLKWQENLIWERYDLVEKAFNQTIKSIVPLHDNYGLTGIAFSLDDDTILSIYDAGDVIAAKYV